MKRRSIAVVVALLAVALLPGYAGAAPLTPGTLDQNVDWGESFYSTHTTVTQTFTAGIDGALTHLMLYCAADGSVDVTVAIGSSSRTSTCNGTADWVDFEFTTVPPTVHPNVQYTMTVTTADEWVQLGIAGSAYAGGQAADNDGNPIEEAPDFAFRTYVLQSPTTTYTWSAAQVTAGSSTAVTLTTVTQFPALVRPSVSVQGVSPNATRKLTYGVTLAALPAWFTPTGITCSAQVLTADCSLVTYQAGMAVQGDGSAMTVTVVVTGMAAPPLTAAGGTGAAKGDGCQGYAIDENPVNSCFDAEADLAVVAPAATPTPTATAAPTPPPTTTATSPGTMSGPLPWSLAAGLCFLLGSLFVVRRRRAVRVL